MTKVTKEDIKLHIKITEKDIEAHEKAIKETEVSIGKEEGYKMPVPGLLAIHKIRLERLKLNLRKLREEHTKYKALL